MANKTYAHELISIMLTSIVLPLFSQLITITKGYEDTLWSSERLLVIYISSLSGVVVLDKLIRTSKSMGIYDKGLRLDNSDTLLIIFEGLPPCLAIFGYDDLVSLIVLLMIFGVSILILWKDGTGVNIHPAHMICSGLVGFGILIVTRVYPLLKINNEHALVAMFIYCIIAMCACVSFDLVSIVIKKWFSNSKVTPKHYR